MFGKKDQEKRSLEDMFTPIDAKEAYGVEEREESVKIDRENDSEVVDDLGKSQSKIVPFDCFGIEEEKAEKWIAKCIKFWFGCMSFLWFLFGALTFAPVIYISNKVNVIFKDKKKSFVCATAIHGVFLLLIIIFLFFK